MTLVEGIRGMWYCNGDNRTKKSSRQYIMDTQVKVKHVEAYLGRNIHFKRVDTLVKIDISVYR